LKLYNIKTLNIEPKNHSNTIINLKQITMKTKKVKTGLLAIIFALTFIFAISADMFAQQGQVPGKGHKQEWQNDGHKCCMKMLDLTEDCCA